MNDDGLNASVRVIATLTSFNRRDATLACLARLESAARQAGLDPRAVLVDDGSTDGTAAAVRSSYPWVEVIEGDGSLFWNRGMHAAQARAMTSSFDYVLWLNDDTELLPDSLTRLLETEAMLRRDRERAVIVVGSTSDRSSGRLSYGGFVAPWRGRPFTYRRVWHASEPVECHVMNGNVVLIPRAVAETVGNLDPVFEHAMGDTDYALRARAAGFGVYVAPGYVGHCTNNPVAGTYRDPGLPFGVRWRKMLSRKGLPPRSWRHFTRRHGGPAWLVYFVWPYARLIAESLRNGLPGASRGQNGR